jgi:hypothetical protein
MIVRPTYGRIRPAPDLKELCMEETMLIGVEAR